MYDQIHHSRGKVKRYGKSKAGKRKASCAELPEQSHATNCCFQKYLQGGTVMHVRGAWLGSDVAPSLLDTGKVNPTDGTGPPAARQERGIGNKPVLRIPTQTNVPGLKTLPAPVGSGDKNAWQCRVFGKLFQQVLRKTYQISKFGYTAKKILISLKNTLNACKVVIPKNIFPKKRTICGFWAHKKLLFCILCLPFPTF